MILIGYANLWINRMTVVSSEINRRRALIVLGKIDEIYICADQADHTRLIV